MDQAVHELGVLLAQVMRAPPTTQWTVWTLLVFALVFLLVGVFRVVEFDGLGLSPLRRTLLIALHISGVVTFALMLALFAVDFQKLHATLLVGLMMSSLILLFPVHIYLGILRRLLVKQP